MDLFCVKTPAGKLLAQGFEKKTKAKAERDRLVKEGESCVVSRGSDHYWGESHPDPGCLAKERTSKRKHRKPALAPTDPVPV